MTTNNLVCYGFGRTTDGYLENYSDISNGCAICTYFTIIIRGNVALLALWMLIEYTRTVMRHFHPSA